MKNTLRQGMAGLFREIGDTLMADFLENAPDAALAEWVSAKLDEGADIDELRDIVHAIGLALSDVLDAVAKEENRVYEA